jgi:hypothetical protein
MTSLNLEIYNKESLLVYEGDRWKLYDEGCKVKVIAELVDIVGSSSITIVTTSLRCQGSNRIARPASPGP